MDEIGSYEERRFPEFRIPTIDTLDLGKKKHHIPLLLEIDVTEAREYIQEYKLRTGEGLSFTGWVMVCIGKAVSEHKHMHAMRKGRKSLILFEDVDITVGSMGKYSGYGWGIPIGIHPLVIALGNIARKPGVIGEEIAIREYLSMTVMFDHEVTDGAPVFRFVRRLNEYLEQGYGLDR